MASSSVSGLDGVSRVGIRGGSVCPDGPEPCAYDCGSSLSTGDNGTSVSVVIVDGGSAAGT